ncbi:MAG: ABC transporter permease [Terriglobales bacterium]|jgi:putative ABC transport system permease protein
MVWGETFQVAVQALRADKVKAMLTMLGVIIGSGCIVLVVTVALTGKRYIISQIEGVGSNITYAQLTRSGKTTSLADEITLADIKAVREQIPEVVEVAGTRDLPMTVIVEGHERPISMVGVTEGFQKIRNLEILTGRFFDPEDMTSRNKVTLLTQELADALFPKQDPLGQQVKLNDLNFTVIGVFRERVSTFGASEIQKYTAIVPYQVMQYFTGNEYAKVLYAQAGHPEDVAAVTNSVGAVLRSRHRSEAVYEVQDLRSLLEATKRISAALTVTLLFVAGIALTISGVGIMNIMLVTVTERTREIGVRKAIGAQRKEILYQFLIEAFLISGIGAAIGILIAVAVPVLARPLLPEGIYIPISWWSVLIAFTVSCVTGVFFGYLPANKAASLQPTEALRYE